VFFELDLGKEMKFSGQLSEPVIKFSGVLHLEMKTLGLFAYS